MYLFIFINKYKYSDTACSKTEKTFHYIYIYILYNFIIFGTKNILKLEHFKQQISSDEHMQYKYIQSTAHCSSTIVQPAEQ